MAHTSIAVTPAFSQCFASIYGLRLDQPLLLLLHHNNQRNPLTKKMAEKKNALEQDVFWTHEIALSKLRNGAGFKDLDELEYECLGTFAGEKDIADALAAPPCMGVSFETCKMLGKRGAMVCL